jgi:hypothetical protein
MSVAVTATSGASSKAAKAAPFVAAGAMGRTFPLLIYNLVAIILL